MELWGNSIQPGVIDLCLLHEVFGCAPQNISDLDQRGWGDSVFSVKERSFFLLESSPIHTRNTIWKRIWSNMGMMKINIFSWILSHGKILTSENLKKRGILDPS
jgi:hypothetical protein